MASTPTAEQVIAAVIAQIVEDRQALRDLEMSLVRTQRRLQDVYTELTRGNGEVPAGRRIPID